ncbi:hypothetical protein [Niveispirillum sp. KHB5.9]|uniref:hypothetical protein n=1 Tax=Niveispirillum sp. KHB5.9 TaxID=3400269 RepID=UPI003A8B4499
MTLLYLIVGSSLFMLFILALHHWLGQSAIAPLADRETALRRFQEQLPDAGAAGATLSRDGLSALVDLGDADRFGLLLPMGRYWAARVVGRGGIRRWTLRDGALSLTLADFTAPAFRLVFADAAAAEHWQERLAALPQK